MKFIILILCLLPALISLAEEAKPKQYQTMDLKQFDKMNEPPASNKKVKNFTVECKDEEGRVLKSSDAAYSQCVMKSQKDLSEMKK